MLQIPSPPQAGHAPFPAQRAIAAIAQGLEVLFVLAAVGIAFL